MPAALMNWPVTSSCTTRTCSVEYRTSRGRIDLVLQTADYIYVMEFKLDGSAEDAIKQIEDRQYALPFSKDPRRLFKIGVNFSSTTRNIEKWVVR